MLKLAENLGEDFRLLDGVREHLVFVSLPAGSVLFTQGDTQKMFVFLNAGIAKVTRVSTDGDQLITELLLAGDLCGALCALDRCPYPVSAVAVTDVEVARLDTAAFYRLAELFPSLHRCSLEGCATKVRQQRAMMTSIALERIPRRVWKVFYVLALRVGELSLDGLRIPFPFSRQEVAEMIGATSETVTRVFTAMKKSGEIAERDGYITLLGCTTIADVKTQAAL